MPTFSLLPRTGGEAAGKPGPGLLRREAGSAVPREPKYYIPELRNDIPCALSKESYALNYKGMLNMI